MQNILFSLQAVFPLFVMVAIGYFLRVKGMVNADFVTTANRVVFRMAMPIYLFFNVSTSKFDLASDMKYVLVCLACVVGLVGVLFVFVPMIVKDARRRGVIIQALFRSNFLLLGLPICENMFGADGRAMAALLVAFVVALFNVSAVITLTVFNGTGKVSVKGIIKGIVFNPLIIGSVAGLLATTIGLELPGFVNQALSDVAQITTPLALLALGASFTFGQSRKNAKEIAWVMLFRLFITPVTMAAIFILLGYRGVHLGTAVIIFASPIAVTSFVMAHEAGADSELAGQLVVFSTALSSISLFFVIYGMKSFGLI